MDLLGVFKDVGGEQGSENGRCTARSERKKGTHEKCVLEAKGKGVIRRTGCPVPVKSREVTQEVTQRLWRAESDLLPASLKRTKGLDAMQTGGGRRKGVGACREERQGEGRPLVGRIKEASSTRDANWKAAFLTCLQNCTAKPNREKTNRFKKQQQQKGQSNQAEHSTQGLFRLQQPMTHFCRQEAQSSIGEGGCQGECTRPRNPAPSLPGVPLGTKASSSPHHIAHLPDSSSTLNITQPRKMPCALPLRAEFQLGLSNSARHAQRREM